MPGFLQCQRNSTWAGRNSLPWRISLDATWRQQVYLSQHGQLIGMWKASEPGSRMGRLAQLDYGVRGFAQLWSTEVCWPCLEDNAKVFSPAEQGQLSIGWGECSVCTYLSALSFKTCSSQGMRNSKKHRVLSLSGLFDVAEKYLYTSGMERHIQHQARHTMALHLGNLGR